MYSCVCHFIDGWLSNWRKKVTRMRVYYFFGLTGPLGGVTGRPTVSPPYVYFTFFSEGFKICSMKEIRNEVVVIHSKHIDSQA